MLKIHLDKYNKGIVDEEDIKDDLMDISTLIMIGVDDKILSTCYMSDENRMVYNEA